MRGIRLESRLFLLKLTQNSNQFKSPYILRLSNNSTRFCWVMVERRRSLLAESRGRKWFRTKIEALFGKLVFKRLLLELGSELHGFYCLLLLSMTLRRNAGWRVWEISTWIRLSTILCRRVHSRKSFTSSTRCSWSDSSWVISVASICSTIGFVSIARFRPCTK